MVTKIHYNDLVKFKKYGTLRAYPKGDTVWFFDEYEDVALEWPLKKVLRYVNSIFYQKTKDEIYRSLTDWVITPRGEGDRIYFQSRAHDDDIPGEIYDDENFKYPILTLELDDKHDSV